ncbi:hypothetical protein ACHAWF_009942 [Thalassiosira exigua]
MHLHPRAMGMFASITRLFFLVMALASHPVPCSPFVSPASPPTRRRSLHFEGADQNQSGTSTRPFPSSAPPLVPPCMTAKRTDAVVKSDDGTNLQRAVREFISMIQTSLDDGSFESFTLKGPPAPRKRRSGKDETLDERREKLRGKFKTITGRLVLLQDKKKRKSRGKKEPPTNESEDADASSESLFVQATIKYHLATDVAKNWKVDRQSQSAPTEVESGLKQLFSTALGNDVGDDSGAPLSEWGVQNMDGEELGLLTGELITSKCAYKLQLKPRHKASFRSSTKKGTQKQTNGRDLSLLRHDRAKNTPLSPSSEFFQKLGVSNADGKPMSGMASKLRQCQKFVEIVSNLVESPPPSRIRVTDMGCGRGYLTFSLHSYLCNTFAAMQGETAVETLGIDRRPKLIQEINGIAQDLGGEFASLKFVEGTIGQTNPKAFAETLRDDSDRDECLDILIALHACDTATDDALWYAICRGADIIVTAPCCQHELRPQIDRHAADNPNHPLSDILRHAIYRERSTEVVTDAMRAILLEIAGYSTQVFEFIGGEHTAKNVMICATKDKRRRGDEEQKIWIEGRRKKLIELAQMYGIRRQRLAMLMGESTTPAKDCPPETARRNLTGMAPL